jgi:S1-C subfamily serine protease
MKKRQQALFRSAALAAVLGLAGGVQAQALVNRDTTPPPAVSPTGAAPSSFAQIIEKVAPTVVSLEVRRPAHALTAPLRPLR